MTSIIRDGRRGAMLTLTIETRSWPLRDPLAISRGVQTDIDAIIVTLAVRLSGRHNADL